MFDLTSQLQRREAVEWAQRVRALLQKEGQSEATAQIDQAIEQFMSDKLSLAVLGKAKRGKSTLVNALLGRHDDTVAPVDVLPASSTVSRFFLGDQELVTVYFSDGRTEGIPYAHIRDYVTEENNPENRKGVTFVDIQGPFPDLDPHLVLIDTPGAGSLHLHHDTLLHAFLPAADAAIFLVTAEMPIDQTELDLLRQIRAADIRRIFFVINQVDRTGVKDLQDAIEHNTRALALAGVHVSFTHRISALQAFQGNPNHGGIDPLIAEIREHLSVNRTAGQLARLKARVEAAAGPFLNQVRLLS
jgi:predicted GTPase